MICPALPSWLDLPPHIRTAVSQQYAAHTLGLLQAPTLSHSPASAQNAHLPLLSPQGSAPAGSHPPSSSSTAPAATAAVVMAVMLRTGGHSLQSRHTWRQPQLTRPKA